MFDINILKDYLQNKNFVMCVTSVFFMLGILSCFSEKEIVASVVLTSLLIILLSLRIFSVKRVILLAFVFYFGFFFTFFRVNKSDDLVPLAPLNSTFYGRIVSIPNSSESGKARFFFEVERIDNETVFGKSLVTLIGKTDDIEKLNIGQKISIRGNLRKPFISTNPSQFDYSSYLRNFNVFTVIYSDDDKFKISNEKMNLKWLFLNKLNTARNNVLKVHSKYLQSPNLEILGGIVFGDDAVAPPEYIKNSFINSGLLHILAASGMNVAFIFSFWFYILQFFRIPYRTRVLSGMIMIILYTLMTGLGPAVIRASLMLLFVCAGKLIDRDAHSVSLLSLVAVLMLLYNPAYINDVGFQLSFFVTFGLITTANIISQKFEKVPNWLKAVILIPLIAQIWIIPLQMFYFNTVSIYSISANIVSAPIISVISFCGFVSSLIAMIKPVADFICYTFDFYNNYLLNVLVWISEFFGNLPHCIVQTTHPGIFQLILYYAMLVSVTYLIKYNKYKNAFITVASISLILFATTISPISKDLEVIAFDVQNADSFLIKTPQNKYFFIDTGKAPYRSGNSQAKIIMLKYLKDRGIKNIEGVIVTHFDNDHSGGTSDIISDTKVRKLYLNSTYAPTQTAKNIFKTAKEIKQKFVIAKNNELIYKEPDLKMTLLKADIKGKDESNASSLITLVSYKDFDMLFMGDAGAESFEQVKRYIPHNVEVLKVGHHGAGYTVTPKMTEYLGNKVSLISTGINYFGHPNKGTLDILRNTVILRTDYNNSVKISTDGISYQIYSYDTHDKKYKLKEKFYAVGQKNQPNG